MSTVEVPNRTGQLGMTLDETITDRQRWGDAVDRMAMALSEAGYPTTIERFSMLTGRENEMVFHGGFPPYEVALRAAQLCGVGDLMEVADVAGWPGAALSHD